MHFRYHPAIRRQHPELAAGALHAAGIRADVSAEALVARHEATARARLAAAGTESELPEGAGLAPHLRAHGPQADAVPLRLRVAAAAPAQGRRDAAHPSADRRVQGDLDGVRDPGGGAGRATHPRLAAGAAGAGHGALPGLHFNGEVEHPEPGEVTFAGADGNAHARRWTHRQSGLSAVRDGTRAVLVVIEGVHATAAADVAQAVAAIAEALREAWGVEARRAMLTAAEPAFEFRPAFSSAARAGASW